MLLSLLTLLLSICITATCVNSYFHRTNRVKIITTCNNKDRLHSYKDITRLHSNKDITRLYSNNNDDEILEYDYNTGIVMMKKVNGQYKKRDDRESLPFSISYIDENSEEKQLGVWHLDASTSNGDILALGKKGTFVVDKVSYLYKFTGSSFKVFKKKLSVTSINSPWNEINNDILQ